MLYLLPNAHAQSCAAECGIITEEGCACDAECEFFGDCCADKGQFCNAQPPDPVVGDPVVGGDPEPIQFTGTVAAHNSWRTQVGSPNLVWNNAVAAVAQQWADDLASRPGCRLEHRSSADLATLEGGLGENLFIKGAFPNIPVATPKEVVDSWGSEIQFYDSTTHTCNAPPGDSCGHYTQVVWSTTQEVGCGTATCVNGNFQNVIWVCNYRPPGNVLGQAPF
ncbi:MAG: CAP domain-containing protein [Pseudomonadota bacterium]|nr:CAP domain-containing protein [Pseudomonadota bacterium]